MKITTFLLAALFGFLPAMCQQIKLAGKIFDNDKRVIAGATITNKTTNSTTISNSRGEFSLSFISGDSLFVTAVGYESKTVVANAQVINIGLEPAATVLSEVMVNTGYQKISPERITGSFEKLDEKLLNQTTSPNIIDRLNGIATGILFPKKVDGPVFMIRGLSTIQGPKSPLIVVDNFPYEGNISNIDPNDVESVTILKDAAASSIWGARAGNGVIVITTRKGKFNQPMSIRASSRFTVTEKPPLFDIPQLSSSSFIDVEQFLFSKGYYNPEITSSSRPALSPVVEILIKKANGQFTAAHADSMINDYRSVDIRKEYLKYFYRPALDQQQSLSLMGGSNRMAYTFAGGFNRSQNFAGVESNRITLRMENIYKPLKNLQITIAVAYTDVTTISSNKPGYNDVRVGARQIPYLRFADDSGNAIAVARAYREIYTDTAGRGKLLNWKYYPLNDYSLSKGKNQLKSIVASFGLQYQFGKGLSAELKYQNEDQLYKIRSEQGVESYAVRSMINTYSQINPSTGIVKYNIPLGGILTMVDQEVKSFSSRQQLNFNRKWKKHFINAIAGSEVRQIRSLSSSATVYGYRNDPLGNAKADYINPVPSYITGASIFVPDGTSLSDQVTRFVSLYSNLSYTYNDRYILSLSARRDASNLFGLRTNDKWNPLWSAGAGWNINREKFFHSSFFSLLKARISYGYSGNTDPARAALTTIRYIGSAQQTNFQSAGVSQYSNPELSWERVRIKNAGVDFKINQEKLSGTIEYYSKKGIDLFGGSLIDYTVGIGSQSVVRNVASMKGQGVDVTIDAKIIDRLFKWQCRFLFSYYSEKTISFYQTGTLARNFVGNGNTISPLVGQPLYSIISYKWAGLDSTGAPRGYLGKTPSTNYSLIMGAGNPLSDLVYRNALPKFYGAFSPTFGYKNFSLTGNFIYKLGYYFRRETISYPSLFSNGNNHPDYELRWQKPGDELKTSVPAMVYPLVSNRDVFYGQSDVLVERGDHVRLQFVTLSYSRAAIRIGNSSLKDINIHLTLSDGGIIWRANKKKIDPDYGSAVPPSKSLSAGLNLSF